MIFVKPDDVVIPENRFRRDFDERRLNELRDSILRNGLMHLPTVEKQGDKYALRSGERRLRILQRIAEEGLALRVVGAEIPRGMVPLAEWGELTELQRLEIEVEENVVRADFTWQERTKALAALHDLRKRQNPEQTLTATASEVVGKPAQGDQVSAVSDAVVVAKHLHIPEVAKAKSQKDALKAIRKIAEAGHRAKLAELAIEVQTPHTLLKGDSRDLVSKLPSESFDVILTDPPYGVDADDFGDMAAEQHGYEDSQKHWESILAWFCDESFRVAKERAHCYVFCDPRRFDRLATLMVLANWTVFPTPLVWSKGTGMLPFPDHGPRRTYECVLYAWKGDRKTLQPGQPDVIDIPGVRKAKRAAQKPVALYRHLLARSANPGDVVLDCFGGTGPILVAANLLRLVATYIEQADDAFNIAQLRADEREVDDGAVEDDGLGDIPV